jgi:hypothetical protein
MTADFCRITVLKKRLTKWSGRTLKWKGYFAELQFSKNCPELQYDSNPYSEKNTQPRNITQHYSTWEHYLIHIRVLTKAKKWQDKLQNYSSQKWQLKFFWPLELSLLGLYAIRRMCSMVSPLCMWCMGWSVQPMTRNLSRQWIKFKMG